MSVSASAIRKMVMFGLSAEQIADLCEALEEGYSIPLALKNRRAYDRDRKAEKRNSGGKSGGHDDDESGGKSGGIPPEKASLACVVDNSLPIEIYPNSLSLSQVREFAGDALASMATHPGISTLAPLLGLLKADEPCAQSEVLDGVAKAAAWYRANRPPGSMTNWKLACTMAVELRDARIAGIPKPKAPHERPDTPSTKRTAREDNLSRSLAGFASVVGS